MNKTFSLFAIAASLIALPSYGANSVASINGVPITEAQLSRAVQQSGLPDSPQLRAVMKTQLIARELFRQEASKKKELATSAETKAAIAEARDNAMIQQYIRAAIKPNPITDAQIKARFDDIVASLGELEYKPRLILAQDAAAAASLLEKLKAGADFANLARESSKAPSAKRAGELEWVSFKAPLVEGKTQSYPLPLAEAIVKLPAGAVSAEPVVVNGQHYILKVDEVRPTTVPKYEQVKDTIRQLLEQQEIERATAALVAGLLKNAKIQQ